MVETFTPRIKHESSHSPTGFMDVNLGDSLIGSELGHRSMQLLAMAHARKNIGFDSQVAFLVNWGDMAPSFFVYGDNQEWLQLSAEGRIVLPENLWPRYTSRHTGIDKETRFFE